ncbi:hypothetical protein T492DRAFT_888134 [Pavlovales sp. CCMP2436]|nr:hypothetical protein T492DRAFT_888134 [Pavlovales sp. CCMP2436]
MGPPERQASAAAAAAVDIAAAYYVYHRFCFSVVPAAFMIDASGVLSAVGNEVRVAAQATRQSTKLNALWHDGRGLSSANPGMLAWDVHMTEGEGCKSFSYGGNLSDGGALMRHAFGPCVLAGSVVSIRAELSKQADATYVLKISLALDGEGLVRSNAKR